MQYSGWYTIDGMDLWTVFGMIVEAGSDGFLKYPAKKESITHDWQDSNGLDVDLSRIFFQSRDVSLNVALVADDEEQFWAKYKGFLAQMAQPGQRRITVTELGQKSFFVYYKECNNFDRLTRVRVGEGQKVACKFTIVFTENNPAIDNTNVFLVDEEGRFLIT